MSVYLIYKFISVLVRLLPRRISYLLADLASTISWLISRKIRLNIQSNLSRILGVSEKKCLLKSRKAVVYFTQYLVDFFLFPHLDEKKFLEIVTPPSRDKVEDLFKQKKGIIALSGHLGHWELGALVLGLWGFPVNVIYLPHQDQRIDRLFLQTRLRQIHWVPVGSALRRGMKVLKHGEILATGGDLVYGEGGVEINFLGKPARFPTGPALLSIRTGAPILVAFFVRDSQGNYRGIMEEPIYPLANNDQKNEAYRITKEFVKILERYVYKYPEQWHIFQKFWL
ncbi:MAG: lysophospholipid acyltransferase family protein [Elusimicrobiota bacterium]